MARHKVEISGVNTANIKVLTSSEMDALFERVKNHDEKAREELVNGNLKLVLSILKMFQGNENMDDLFQVGCIGLLKAIDNFDKSYNVKFSTYSVPMIQGEIRRYIRDGSTLRISRSVKDLSYKVIKACDTLSLKTGKMPTIEEIAAYLNEDIQDVYVAIESRKSPVSIFEPIYSDGGDTIYLCDQIKDDKIGENLDMRVAVDNAMKELNERERYIIDQRFIMGKTQTELSSELGISQAQISRVEKNAIDSLRRILR